MDSESKKSKRKHWLIPLQVAGILLIACASVFLGVKLAGALSGDKTATTGPSTTAPGVSAGMPTAASASPAAITSPGNHSGDSTPAPETSAGYEGNMPVAFEDKQVEAWIRAHCIKKEGDITVADMLTVTSFEYDPNNDSSITGTISSLGDLRYCLNLERLYIANQPVESIESLRALNKLKWVNLFETDVSDLSPLAGKELLTFVWIGGNGITDFTPVLSLPNLMDFNANGTKLTDISPLRNTHRLRSFYCTNKLDDYSPLFSHPGLKAVGLSGLTNEDFIAILGKLKNLTGIQIENSFIQDSSLFLLKDFHLENLILDSCGIKDISGLSFLTSINDLRLTNNRIVDISALSGLRQVSYCLDIRYNKIRDYSPLKNLTYAKSIWINPEVKDPVFDGLEQKGCNIIRSN